MNETFASEIHVFSESEILERRAAWSRFAAAALNATLSRKDFDEDDIISMAANYADELMAKRDERGPNL